VHPPEDAAFIGQLIPIVWTPLLRD